MKTIFTLLLLLSATAFTQAAKKPKAAPKVAAAKPAVEKTEPHPSRMVGADMEQYVAQLRGRLAINSRDRCPFGMHQDLSKSKQSLLPIPMVRKAQKQSTPFSVVVKAIPIAAVFPLEQEFLVGSRTFRTGQSFPVVAGGENISVRVEAVRSASVRFKNLNSGEVVDKRLDLLPNGVTPGGGGSITVPGVTSQRDESASPLHINIHGK